MNVKFHLVKKKAEQKLRRAYKVNWKHFITFSLYYDNNKAYFEPKKKICYLEAETLIIVFIFCATL